MSTEQNKATMKRLLEDAWASDNPDEIIDAVTTSGYKAINPPAPFSNREEFKQYVKSTKQAFPDIKIVITDLVAEGDKVAYSYSVSGTHRGEFLGIPATGKRGEIAGTGIVKFVDGKAAEVHENYDALGLLQQLGVIPS